MPFNSLTFAVFFVIVLALHWSVRGRLRNVVLVAASYVFYGWWDWRFLSLLMFSTAVDFTVGSRMGATEDPVMRRRLLVVSAVANLGVLAAFKYLNFFADSLTRLFDTVGLEADPFTLNVVLPVGISFYTFQTLSYTFDIHRGRIEPTRDLVGFATYVAYFPQLVAGPIERARVLLPAILDSDRSFPSGTQRADAVRLIVVGLAKKVVLADGVASIVNSSFDNAANAGWVTLSIGVIGFAIQIYGDFSGYTDIARGVSRFFGIELSINFTQPYLSRNITEFWRRWHISLSNWLRDYLYIALGGNRHGVRKTYRNLMLTMLLGGLWHGASWTFVVWGGLHGLYLVVHKLLTGGAVPAAQPTMRDVPNIVLTNIAVLVAWVFFRADGFGQAWDVLAGIATFRPGPVLAADVAMIGLFVVLLVVSDLRQRRHHEGSTSDEPAAQHPLLLGASLGSVLVAIVLFSGGTPVPFIYFQF
jgi:D-alanyl-lipoteichoic acid acyltransferase DltB (MBOAT superfamily)